MESKTTPGPWEWDDYDGYLVMSSGGLPVIRAFVSGGAAIIDVENSSDARLIEKAPEMYAVLLRLVRARDGEDVEDFTACDIPARAIIRYVEGDDGEEE